MAERLNTFEQEQLDMILRMEQEQPNQQQQPQQQQQQQQAPIQNQAQAPPAARVQRAESFVARRGSMQSMRQRQQQVVEDEENIQQETARGEMISQQMPCMTASMLVMLLLLLYQGGKYMKIAECSQSLSRVGLFYFAYTLYFLIRDTLICAYSFCCKKSDQVAQVSRFVFIIIDIIPYSMLTIYSTRTLTSREVYLCREEEEINSFWFICLILTIFAWFYTVLLMILGVILPIVACAMCFCYQHFQGQRNARIQQRIPVVNNVIKSLEKKQKAFKDLSSTSKQSNQCIICFEEFKDDSEVSELNCDSRHIFHTKCLAEWFRQGELKCPLCKKEVEPVNADNNV